MKRIAILAVCLIVQMGAHVYGRSQLPNSFKEQPATLGFEENKGQITDQHGNMRQDIQYTLKAPGLTIFVGNGVLHYQFYRTEELKNINIPGLSKATNGKKLPAPIRTTTYRMDVDLVGANANVIPTVTSVIGGVNHYYTNSKQKDGVAVRMYQKITYPNIYPGIDWVLYVQNNSLKYDFIVHPGANAATIQLNYNGANNIVQQKDGSIQAITPYGIITEQAPKSYQQEDHKVISSAFQLNGKNISFGVKDAYQGALVIDPGVVWATYYGGGNESIGGHGYTSVVCDPSGYVYMQGLTSSANNIATTGSYQDTLMIGGIGISTLGGINNFIVKFDSLGHRIWATYYGGRSLTFNFYGFTLVYPTESSIACDDAYHIYLAGYTGEASGITTEGSYQDTLTSGGFLFDTYPVSTDAFLVQFDSAGERQWGTYYGGNEAEKTAGVICGKNASGEDVVYIYGNTESTDGIATEGSYQDTIGPCSTCGTASNSDLSTSSFLAQFNSNGTIQWGTYYGDGNQNNDNGIGAAVCDMQGNIDALGHFTPDSTVNNAAYTTPGTFMPALPAGTNSYEDFVVQFNNNGMRNWGTFFGENINNTNLSLETNAITCDGANHIYLAGVTSDTIGISTPGAFLEGYPGVYTGFLIQFSSISTQPIWGTYYWGDITALTCDSNGIIYAAGTTNDPNPPLANEFATPGSYQENLIIDTVGGTNYSTNIFIEQFNNSGSRLWGTYFGGGNESLNEFIYDKSNNNLACDHNGNFYLTGITTIDTHIAIPGSFQDTLGTIDTNSSITSNTKAFNAFLVRFTPIDVAITGWVHDTVCTEDASVNVTLQNKGHLPESNIVSNALYVYYDPSTGISDTSTATTTTNSPLTPGATTTVTLNGLTLHPGTDTVQIYLQHIVDDSSFTDDTLYTVVVAVDSPSISGIIKSDTGIVWYFSDSNAQNVTHYQWYFGDGNTATGATTNHTYNASGNYTVMLVASNGCKSDTVTTNITATGLGVANLGNTGNIIVYPNPAQKQLNVQVPEKLQATEWQIINSVGAAVYSEKTDGQNGTKLIDVHSLSDGYYILKVGTNEGNYNIPFEIMR